MFSLTWPASTQIYLSKRKRLHKKRVRLSQDWFGTQTWPPFHCVGTQIWPPSRHVKTQNTARVMLSLYLMFVTLILTPGKKICLCHEAVSLSFKRILRVANKFFGIQEKKSMHERWDAKNNHRDHGIARNFGSGLRD